MYEKTPKKKTMFDEMWEKQHPDEAKILKEEELKKE